MLMSRWMFRGAIAAVMSGCMLLSGCGESTDSEATAKNETPKNVRSEAPAPALSGSQDEPNFASNDDAPPAKNKTVDVPLPGDPSADKDGDIVSKLELPRPVLPELTQSDDSDPPINPADAVHKGPWTTNFEAAKKQAKAEGKDILMDFTGSDWCGYCIELNRTVFSKPEFIKYAPAKFVLLELDFPKQHKLAPALQKQNDSLNSAFAVEGFPTIVLTDADGRPYAATGFQQGGPAKYIAHLEELRAIKAERDAKFKAAAGAKGIERAKLLSEGLDALVGSQLRLAPEALLPAYAPIAKEIVALDADGGAGLKKVWTDRMRHSTFVARIEKLNEFARSNIDNPKAMLSEIETVEAEFKDYAPGAQNLRNFKFRVLLTNNMYSEFHKTTDEVLANKATTANERLEILGLKLSIIAREKKYPDGEKLLGNALLAHADDKMYQTQIHLFRARLAAVQKKVPEAKAALKQARAVGEEQLKDAIDEFESELLEDLGVDTPTVTPKGK